MELTTAEVTGIIDQAIPLGLRSIKITGGEPFVRDDIADIVGHADRAGVSVSIETNAMLLGEEAAQALGQCSHLRHVAVSLDGASAESHAMLRGTPGAFERACDGIRRLVGHGIEVQVIACLHRGNIAEIEDVMALAAKLGVRSFKINPVVRMGRGQEMADRGEALGLADVLDVTRRLDDGLGDRFEMPIHMSMPVAFRSLKAIRRQGLGDCGVMNLLGVLPGGELSMCGVGDAHADLAFGHVQEAPIREIWEHSLGLARVRREIADWPTGICRQCMVRAYCTWGYCRAEAYAASGSLAAPAPLCQECYEAGLFPEGRLLDRGNG